MLTFLVFNFLKNFFCTDILTYAPDNASKFQPEWPNHLGGVHSQTTGFTSPLQNLAGALVSEGGTEEQLGKTYLVYVCP